MPSDATRPASSGRQYFGSRSPRFTTAENPAFATSPTCARVGCPAVPRPSLTRMKFLMSSSAIAASARIASEGDLARLALSPTRSAVGLLGAGADARDDELRHILGDAHGDERRLEGLEDLGAAARAALVEADHPVDGRVRHGLAMRRRVRVRRRGLGVDLDAGRGVLTHFAPWPSALRPTEIASRATLLTTCGTRFVRLIEGGRL